MEPPKDKEDLSKSTSGVSSPGTTFHHSFLTLESNNNASPVVPNLGGSLEYVFPSRSKITKQQVKKEELEWKYDFLPELPNAVLQMYWLEKMTVTYCNMEILSPKIANLQSLKCLVLDHNHLKWLPPEIGFLKKLEILFFRGNEITEV
jgi:Leucine-rich repeat (LRR) protein